jgi:predicted ferric reductase
MALALMPVLFMLAAKRNMISVLTGVSHERLQVFHQWVAYFMFILALLHTFPFIYFNAQAGMSMIMWRTSYQYWTGVVA